MASFSFGDGNAKKLLAIPLYAAGRALTLLVPRAIAFEHRFAARSLVSRFGDGLPHEVDDPVRVSIGLEVQQPRQRCDQRVEGADVAAQKSADERSVAVWFRCELGADFEEGEPWAPHVEVDRNLVTGQNPASSRPAAEALLEKLG